MDFVIPSLSYPPETGYILSPWDGTISLWEVLFSDVHRLYGRALEGLDNVLQSNRHAWAARGTAIAVKLKGFSLPSRVVVSCI